MVGWWLRFLLILRLAQPSLTGVGSRAELGKNTDEIGEVKIVFDKVVSDPL